MGEFDPNFQIPASSIFKLNEIICDRHYHYPALLAQHHIHWIVVPQKSEAEQGQLYARRAFPALVQAGPQ